MDLEDLALHNKIEHDASLTHADAAPGGKYAPIDVDNDLLEGLLNVSKDDNYLTLNDLVRVRAARDASLDKPLSSFHDAIARGEVALTVQLFANAEGRILKQFVREWFGEHRFPQGWHKPTTVVGLMSTTRLVNRVGELIKNVVSPNKVD
jgi:Peroxidase, family 2